MTPSQERRQKLEASIVADYNAFEPITDIMRRNGVARSTVFNVLKRNGIQLGRSNLTITQKMEQALRPFVEKFERFRANVGDAGPQDQDAISLVVTIGDCRRAWFALKALQDLRQSPNWKRSQASGARP